MTETIKRKLSDSSAARWTAMLIVSFTMMCDHQAMEFYLK